MPNGYQHRFMELLFLPHLVVAIPYDMIGAPETLTWAEEEYVTVEHKMSEKQWQFDGYYNDQLLSNEISPDLLAVFYQILAGRRSQIHQVAF